VSNIVKLEAENFKRLKAVEIRPEGNAVVIAGRNAQGKSSVLDAIWAAMAGAKGTKEIERPIRDGESKATVAIETDTLRIERSWTASGSSLKVTPIGVNAKMNSPQKVLDEMIGQLSFDPLAFAEAKPEDQVKTLIDLVGREAFDEIAYERKRFYEERTETNRQVKRFKAELDGMAPTEDVPTVDVAETVALLEQVERKARLRERWDDLKTQIEALQAQQAAITAEAVQLPDGDPVALREAIADAARTNEMAAAHRRRVEVEEYLLAETTAVTTLTNKITELDERKAQLLQAAKLPVEGLTFDESGVQLNGVPFIQCSAAERLKVSVAMAMALNPEFRVICIRDASLLDDDSKLALMAMADEHDYQIWYEVVGTNTEIGVVIEDGEVQS